MDTPKNISTLYRKMNMSIVAKMLMRLEKDGFVTKHM